MVGSGLLCAHPGVGNYLITSVGNSVITEVGNYLIIFPQKVGNLADRRQFSNGLGKRRSRQSLSSVDTNQAPRFLICPALLASLSKARASKMIASGQRWAATR